jgi:hypothetical protein
VAPFSLIKLLGERIATVRSEDALNDRLFTVEELRRLRDKFARKKLSKKDIQLAIKKMVRTNTV